MAFYHSNRADGLTYYSALDLARNAEVPDPTVDAYLEEALSAIWTRILLSHNSYVMSRDEHAILNYFRSRGRLQGEWQAEAAIDRFWRHTFGSD